MSSARIEYEDFTDGEYEIGFPTEEEEADFWSGEGHVVFRVISYDPNAIYMSYELDIIEYSGCVGGIGETVGIEYAINEGLLDGDTTLRFGVTYTYGEISADWSRGDGWNTDDDVEWTVGYVLEEWSLKDWLYAWWWHLVGHRIRNWRKS